MEKLGQANRERLLEIIAAQEGQIEVLVARVAELEEEVRRLRRGGGGPGS